MLLEQGQRWGQREAGFTEQKARRGLSSVKGSGREHEAPSG